MHSLPIPANRAWSRLARLGRRGPAIARRGEGSAADPLAPWASISALLSWVRFAVNMFIHRVAQFNWRLELGNGQLKSSPACSAVRGGRRRRRQYRFGERRRDRWISNVWPRLDVDTDSPRIVMGRLISIVWLWGDLDFFKSLPLILDPTAGIAYRFGLY